MTEFEQKAKEMCEAIIQHYEADIIYQSDPFEYCYKLAKATLPAIQLQAGVGVPSETLSCEQIKEFNEFMDIIIKSAVEKLLPQEENIFSDLNKGLINMFSAIKLQFNVTFASKH